MILQTNTLLQGGKYKILRFISSGGFGCTYEAEHVMLHKKVAIKEFFVNDFCDRDTKSQNVTIPTQAKVALVLKLKNKFLEEAVALSSFNHSNIVRVTDVFEENGTAYYVMDYINGNSLHDIIKKNGPLKEEVAIKYILQIAEALKYVHSLNRLHLDIKPGNIMINGEDNAILIDFGASKQYDEEAGENTSTLLGKTPGYAPIEQMGNSVTAFTPSTDIYSLGATLYKIITGKTPTNATLLASGYNSLDLPNYISTSTQKAIHACMQINKNKRPQNIDEFKNIILGEREKINEATIVDIPIKLRNNNKHNNRKFKLNIIKKSWVIISLIALLAVIIPYKYQPNNSNSKSHNAIKDSSIVYIRTYPDKAYVYINDDFIGKTPLSKKLPKGNYMISINKSKYKQFHKEIDCTANSVVINEVLKPAN